jgi:alpha-maltose-1-phosphate synthase
MKALILYPYPLEPDGLSIQGHYLAKGLEELGVQVKSCNRSDNGIKIKLYKEFKPDFIIGIGFWGNTPDLIHHPQKHKMLSIPWLNANGWVANYHDTLNELPLLIATSNWVKSTYIRDSLNGNNIQICPIGFDPQIYHPNSNSNVKKIRADLGIQDDEVMILTAGGDVTSKGAQEMITALAKIDNKYSNWKYILKTNPSFSADNHGKEEAALIEKYNLDKNKFIYLRGEYPPKKMADLIQACDIYAAPSRLEGFGMIQVEAMACGKPVISINVGGPKDTIIHNKTGFLVDIEHEVKLDKEWVYPSMGFKKKMMIEFPRRKTFAYRANTNQLAQYTLKLMQSPELREKMGKAAAKHALKNFHYKVVAKKMLDLIKNNITIKPSPF